MLETVFLDFRQGENPYGTMSSSLTDSKDKPDEKWTMSSIRLKG